MSTLYIVGTPIGNLEDVTLRALSILRTVDTVLCEDTRTTKKLLDRHGISARTMSYHSHSGLARVNDIAAMLAEGKDLALVSDAGTPGISDPGAELVSRIRAELPEVNVESVPGPSALTAALSIAGVPVAEFTFLGFLPHKKGRETLFREIAAADRTYVFYESPHRIEKTLASLATSSRHVTVCRELTKVFEEIVSAPAAEVADFFTKHPDKVRGEFVVIVSGRASAV